MILILCLCKIISYIFIAKETIIRKLEEIFVVFADYYLPIISSIG